MGRTVTLVTVGNSKGQRPLAADPGRMTREAMREYLGRLDKDVLGPDPHGVFVFFWHVSVQADGSEKPRTGIAWRLDPDTGWRSHDCRE